MTIGLKYIGKGNWRPGFPARDLTKSEVEYFGREKLLKTGLYQEIKSPKSKSKKQVDKE